jgi:predicted phage terminase large subunit-like protein
LGGNFFKAHWWRYYKVLPKIRSRSIYADTAQKTATQNDYSVFQCWGESFDGQAVFIDQLRGKWEAPELLTIARGFWNKHKAVVGGGVLRSFEIEDKVSGTGLVQTLAREGIPVRPIQRAVDKITRAMDALPLIESGNVLIPEDAPWLSDFLEEVSQFPNGAHDDQVDPMMDAVSGMLGPKPYFTDYVKLL